MVKIFGSLQAVSDGLEQIVGPLNSIGEVVIDPTLAGKLDDQERAFQETVTAYLASSSDRPCCCINGFWHFDTAQAPCKPSTIVCCETEQGKAELLRADLGELQS